MEIELYNKSHEIIDIVCAFLKIEKERLLSPVRFQEIQNARNYIVKILVDRGYSVSDIGTILGRKHSTIINTRYRCEELISFDSRMKYEFKSVNNIVNSKVKS